MAGGIGNLAAYITRAVGEGLSANKAYEAVRGTELGVRRQSFLQAYGEVRASVARAADVMGLPGGVPVPDEAVSEWQGAPADRYLYQVRVLVRDPQSLFVSSDPVSIVSRDVLTPDEVIGEAVDIWDAGAKAGSGPEGQGVLGGFLTGVFATA